MNGGLGQSLRRLGYARARRLLLATGLGVLLLIAAVLYVRRVDPVEVAATLLFIPIFVGFMFWGMTGGIAAAVFAALGYAALRYGAIDAVGVGRFAGLLTSRAVAYLAFGAIGGWASGQLEGSLAKLELYDQIDDDTGLFNARFFLQATDLEMSRAKRYQTMFSVVAIEVPDAGLEGLPGRRRAAVLRDLGRSLAASVRTVDRAVHGRDRASHRIAVVLPETAAEGAGVFSGRLVQRVSELLAARGGRVSPGDLNAVTVTFPGDEDGLEALRRSFAAIDRAEHPEGEQAEASARTGVPPGGSRGGA